MPSVAGSVTAFSKRKRAASSPIEPSSPPLSLSPLSSRSPCSRTFSIPPYGERSGPRGAAPESLIGSGPDAPRPTFAPLPPSPMRRRGGGSRLRPLVLMHPRLLCVKHFRTAGGGHGESWPGPARVSRLLRKAPESPAMSPVRDGTRRSAIGCNREPAAVSCTHEKLSTDSEERQQLRQARKIGGAGNGSATLNAARVKSSKKRSKGCSDSAQLSAQQRASEQSSELSNGEMVQLRKPAKQRRNQTRIMRTSLPWLPRTVDPPGGAPRQPGILSVICGRRRARGLPYCAPSSELLALQVLLRNSSRHPQQPDLGENKLIVVDR